MSVTSMGTVSMVQNDTEVMVNNREMWYTEKSDNVSGNM